MPRLYAPLVVFDLQLPVGAVQADHLSRSSVVTHDSFGLRDCYHVCALTECRLVRREVRRTRDRHIGLARATGIFIVVDWCIIV